MEWNSNESYVMIHATTRYYQDNYEMVLYFMKVTNRTNATSINFLTNHFKRRLSVFCKNLLKLQSHS